MGYEVLGLAGDATKRTKLEAALTNDGEQANRRAALVALARIGSRDSIPAVRGYLRREGDHLLAYGVLKWLGDGRAVAEALEHYGDASWKALALRVSYWGQREMMGSGAAKRMTSTAWRQAEQKLRSFEQAMLHAEFDVRYFAQSLTTLSDEETEAIAAFLRTMDIRPATSLAFTVCGHLDENRALAFRARLKDAKFESLRSLASR